MKISYLTRWDPETGTAYRQTIRISEEENTNIFRGVFSKGVNYGNSHTGYHVAYHIYGLPEYSSQLKRIITANTIVFVGDGKIPVYGEKV